MTAYFYPEDLKALERAIQGLHAQRETLDQWSAHSVDLSLTIDDLESLRDRMKAEAAELRENLASHPGFPLRAAS